MASRPSPLVAALAGAIAGLLITLTPPGGDPGPLAGTALRMDVEEVLERSDLVVEGRVLSISGVDVGGVICTDVELSVDPAFWGAEQPARTVRLPGGVLPSGRGTLLPGMPSVSEGEDLLLFLGPPSGAGLRMPTGLGQGKYRLVTERDGDRLAVRSASDLVLVGGGRARQVNGRDVVDYAELVGRIEAAAQSRRAGEASGR